MFRSRTNLPPVDEGGYVPPVDEVCLVKQEFVEECDINRMMARYQRSGQLEASTVEGVYEDVSELGDFLSAQLTVKRAEAAFEALPSAVRERFGNQPHQLMEFLGDPANRDEAVELGLVTKVEPPKVEVASGAVLVGDLDEVSPVAKSPKKKKEK